MGIKGDVLLVDEEDEELDEAKDKDLDEDEERAGATQAKAVKQATPGQELFINPKEGPVKGRESVTNPLRDAFNGIKNAFGGKQ